MFDGQQIHHCGKGSRLRPAAVLLPWLIVSLLMSLPASSQSESLDSVDTATSHSLDDVPLATAGTPDGDNLEDSESPDVMPTVQAEGLAMGPEDPSIPVSEAAMGEPRAPNNEGLVWSPTPCNELSPPQVAAPESADPKAWRAVLDETEQRIRVAKQRVESATEAFSGSLVRGTRMPAVRVRYGEERDAAREAYSQTLCEMPTLLEMARREGVEPGVLRPYQSSPAMTNAGY